MHQTITEDSQKCQGIKWLPQIILLIGRQLVVHKGLNQNEAKLIPRGQEVKI
jgi:hypothetical protein